MLTSKGVSALPMNYFSSIDRECFLVQQRLRALLNNGPEYNTSEMKGQGTWENAHKNGCSAKGIVIYGWE